MGQQLAEAYPEAAAVFAEADDVLGFPLSGLAWNGPEELLIDTIHTQPALLVHSIAALRVLQARLPGRQPAFVAGHSLGEISAMVAAGALDFPAAVRLTRRRGELMKQAGEQNPGGMAAILGLDIPTVDALCEQASEMDGQVQVANDNCPGQVVVSGAESALDRLTPLAEAAGARKVVRLAVSIAAHSYLMAYAQTGFNEAVATAGLTDPHIPVVGNVTARPLGSVPELESDLKAQLTSRVRWTESVQFMLDHGVDTFIEIGTGDLLSALIKRIERGSRRISIGEPADFETSG